MTRRWVCVVWCYNLLASTGETIEENLFIKSTCVWELFFRLGDESIGRKGVLFGDEHVGNNQIVNVYLCAAPPLAALAIVTELKLTTDNGVFLSFSRRVWEPLEPIFSSPPVDRAKDEGPRSEGEEYWRKQPNSTPDKMLPLTHKDSRGFTYKVREKFNGLTRLIFSDRNSRNLFLFLLLNLSFAFVELMYGIWTNSLGKFKGDLLFFVEPLMIFLAEFILLYKKIG